MPEGTDNRGVPVIQAASYPRRTGNRLRLLVDGEPAFSRMCEAIEAARHSVWVTVTFLWDSFCMPGERGSAIEVLQRAAARGLDVRLLCWRPDPETESLQQNTFWGSPGNTSLLQSAGASLRVRWDRALPGFCQHQKSWLMDAGTDTETCFVGGINLNPHSMVAPGHHGEAQNHDVYVELQGPSAVDVHHNFVQRWNEASERASVDGRWGVGSESELLFPDRVPAPRGDSMVQIQRTMPSGRYCDPTASPAGATFDIAAGERSNFDQYCAAIAHARRTIYLEHQHIEVPEILGCLEKALRRGTEVVAVVPSEAKLSNALKDLRQFDSFTLAGLAGRGAVGQRKPVWVHSKLMIIDGEWCAVGSCNLHGASLFGNAELNVACWDATVAKSLLRELFLEHIAEDVAPLGDLEALQLFRQVCSENAARRGAGNADWQGIAFQL